MKRIAMHLFVLSLFFALHALGQGAPQTQDSASAPAVLYSFCNNFNSYSLSCTDGSEPVGALFSDAGGNLYGTASFGGSSDCYYGCGAVFMLSPAAGGAWAEKVLYSFCQQHDTLHCLDGSLPENGLIADSHGDLYGMTEVGGKSYDDSGNYGVVYELRPPTSGSGPWSETVLHIFCAADSSCTDGAYPTGGLTIDSAGNLYGAAGGGGGENGVGPGMIFELSPPVGANGTWTYTILYAFCSDGTFDPVGGNISCPGGYAPENVTLDSKGNLYGTTGEGGANCSDCGTVFELSPPSGGSGAWTHTVLYSFCALANCVDGKNPFSGGGLVFGSYGSLYGTTKYGGANTSACNNSGCGVAFKLSPVSGGQWTETTLYSFCSTSGCADGELPYSGLTSDSSGNLYGTTTYGGTPADGCAGHPSDGCGTVFELTPTRDGRSWIYTLLYSFCPAGNCAAGNSPTGGVILDAQGNVYGSAEYGGRSGCITPGRYPIDCGTIFELTPAADFGISADPSQSSSSPGKEVTYAITLTPVNGFKDAVSLSCSVTPSPQLAPQCSLSSSSLTSDTPATLTVTTTAPTVSVLSVRHQNFVYAALVPFLALSLFGAGLAPKRFRKLRLPGLLVCLSITAALGLLAGCGSGGNNGGSHTTPGTPLGTYTIMINGTSGSTQHSTTISLDLE